MLVEEMPPKIYKWRKRNKDNNKQNFTKDVTRGGGAYGVFGRWEGVRIWSYAMVRSSELLLWS